MVKIEVESFERCGREVADESRAHWETVKPYGSDLPPVDVLAAYARLDAVGALHFVTVRDAGQLVGYLINFVLPHHQYGILWAPGDGMWLRPTHRRPRTAARMVAEAERSLAARGVVLMTVPESPLYPGLGRLLVYRGYALTSKAYSRRL